MKKWQLAVVLLMLVTSNFASASRVGDAWKGSKSRIHGRFSKKGNNGGGALALLMTSSTTISSLSSTAMTSGGDMLKEVAIRDEFLDENLYVVKLDSAKGQGEYLQTLAALSGCDGADAQDKFATAIHANFANVYGGTAGGGTVDQDPAVVAGHIDEMIQTDSQLRGVCRDIRVGSNS